MLWGFTEKYFFGGGEEGVVTKKPVYRGIAQKWGLESWKI